MAVRRAETVGAGVATADDHHVLAGRRERMLVQIARLERHAETEGQEENVLTYNKLAIGNGARFTNIYPLAIPTPRTNNIVSSNNTPAVFTNSPVWIADEMTPFAATTTGFSGTITIWRGSR